MRYLPFLKYNPVGVITTSPDLGNLEVAVLIDLTGVNPVIRLTNQTSANPNVSPVPNLADLIWVLNIYSPTGTPIFQSDFTTPWKDTGSGAWTTANITDGWPRPFGQIEWSDYRIEFQVKDTDGNIFPLNKTGNVCRPAGSNKSFADTYGHVKLDVEVLCERANLYIRDATPKLYQGVTGVNQSSYLSVDYPRDLTGTLPAPYILTSFVTDALVPFYQNGEHTATYYSVWRYDLGDNVFIDIRYVAQEAFPVQCNIDLCPIACEVAALEASIENGSCGDVEEARRKLNKISPKLFRALIAQKNPTCGINLPALIDEIKAIGGFSCDCNTTSSGIGTAGTAIPPFLFSVNNEGGDVVASFDVQDGNVVLNIKDKSYTFTQGSAAIQLLTAVGATNNTISLSVNINDLAEDIYQATASSAYLLNLFNSLVISGAFNLDIDGKCILPNNTCNYIYVLSGITTSNAQLVWIKVNGTFVSYPFVFNTTNLTAFQTYLNSLAIGVFVVTSLGAGQVQIATNNNAFGLSDLVYIDSSVNVKKQATITKDCSSISSLTPTQIIQAIYDWLCPLGAEKVYTSEEYSICYIDPLTKTKKTEVIDSGSKLPTFFAALMERGCNTVDFIMALKDVNCAAIQELFGVSENQMGANDFILGTKQGNCARLYPVELGTRQMELGINDQDYLDKFCALQQKCGGGKPCLPYTTFSLTTVLDSPNSNKLGIIVTFVHPEAISSSIRYARIDQGGPLNWSVPIVVGAGLSPYIIGNLDEGQYVVGLTPVYADGRKCSEVTMNSDACGEISSFSAVYDGTNIVVTYAATSAKVRIQVQYPNGGKFIGIYAAGASPVSIAPPPDVIGTFSVTIQSVCNETTGWYGPISAPAVFNITPPDNSTITNNSSITLASVIVTAENELGSVVVSNSTTLAPTEVATFYLADGFYTKITVFSLSNQDGYSLYLITDSGSYVPVNGIFENVTVANGVQIVIIDASPAP